tara:strand:- start:1158 stop:2849 length:1692 start_codon:yes stop_codon:yes gene_type:complete
MTEYSFEDRISRSPEAKRQRAMSRGVVPTSIYNNEEKIIKSIVIGDETYNNTLTSTGGNVRIKISGTVDAMFSMTIVDSSGCNMLRKEIKNIKIGNKGIYNFYQNFPSINSVKGSKGKIPKETYTITVTPSADTKFSSYIDANPYITTIEQFAKSKITIARYENGITGLTFTGSAQSQTGEANQASNYQGYTDISFPIAVKYSSYSAGNIYVKSTDFNTNFIKNNTIKGIVYRDGKTGKSNTYEFGIDPNNDYVGGVVKDFVGKNFEERVKDTITVGSKASWKIEHEKFVIFSLDKDDNVLNFDNCKNNKTKIFKLNNTLDIFPNMQVIGDNIITSVASISTCGKKVTLANEFVIKPHTVLTFINEGSAIVTQTGLDRKPDKKTIVFNRSVDIPDRTVVTFDDDTSSIIGTITQTGSGNTGNGDANDVDLTCTVSIKKFGNKPELVYALDMSKIISKKPNAYNQSVVTAKNTTIAIDMIKFDTDTNRTSKTGTVVRPPSHGTVSAYSTTDDVFAYLPNNNFVGSDSFTFTMSDGTNTSDEKTILIEVLEGASGISDTSSGGGG